MPRVNNKARFKIFNLSTVFTFYLSTYFLLLLPRVWRKKPVQMRKAYLKSPKESTLNRPNKTRIKGKTKRISAKDRIDWSIVTLRRYGIRVKDKDSGWIKYFSPSRNRIRKNWLKLEVIFSVWYLIPSRERCKQKKNAAKIAQFPPQINVYVCHVGHT